MTSFLKKSFVSGAAALTLAGSLMAATAPAQARNGGAVAAGVIGGLAVGAIAGSALANSGPGYGGGYAYPAYAPPPPPPPAPCYVERRPVYDEYGSVAGYHRVRVCE